MHSLAAACGASGSAWAQTFPRKPIRIVVGFAPGGPADVMARLIGQRVSSILGQSVVIDNRPGAGGTIGARAVAESDPDGYTLLLGNTSTLVISPLIYKNVNYDPVKGFAPIATLGTTSNLLIVNPGARRPHRCRSSSRSPARAGQAQLFVGRDRHAAAPDRGDVQAAARSRRRACPLQGRRPVGAGRGRGRNPVLVRKSGVVAAAGPGRQCPGAGVDQRDRAARRPPICRP